MTAPLLPIRMCVVVPLENGTFQAYCIACGWEPGDVRTRTQAERQARNHNCRRRTKKVAS